MDYDTALDYLSSLADFERTGRLTARTDVAPMLELLRELGNPHWGRLTVHVAGSKGKGSVAALTESILRASGLRTGLYTSPHLTSFTDRIQIAGLAVSEEEFARGIADIAPAVQRAQQRWPGRQLVTFDVLTALGFHLFQQRGVQAQVIEVGLGGLLDSTNVFTSKECSVITRIGLEHQDVLGSTLAAIARQKAGIITPHGPVVMGAQPEEAAEVIRAIAAAQAAPLYEAAQLVDVQVLAKDHFAQQLRLQTRQRSYEAQLRLLGAHQLDNAATAVSAIEALSHAGLSVPPSAIERGLAAVHWPARVEVVRQEPLVVVDVAHTVDSARSLSETLLNDLQVPQATLVVGVMRDKDLHGLAQAMASRAQHVIATQADHPRSLPAQAVREVFRSLGVPSSSQPTVASAVDAALARANGIHPIVIFGSVAVAGEARAYLLGQGAPGLSAR